MTRREELLAEIIHDMDPGVMVTKFIIIAEGIDLNGIRAIYTTTNDDSKTWDSLGLLSFGLARENAGVAKQLNEEDD